MTKTPGTIQLSLVHSARFQDLVLCIAAARPFNPAPLSLPRPMLLAVLLPSLLPVPASQNTPCPTPTRPCLPHTPPLLPSGCTAQISLPLIHHCMSKQHMGTSKKQVTSHHVRTRCRLRQHMQALAAHGKDSHASVCHALRARLAPIARAQKQKAAAGPREQLLSAQGICITDLITHYGCRCTQTRIQTRNGSLQKLRE